MKKRKLSVSIFIIMTMLLALVPATLFLTGCSGRGIVMVATGFDHTVVLRQDGTVWAWGRNEEAQLGNGSRTSQFAPVLAGGRRQNRQRTPNLQNITAIASHKIHTLALTRSGHVWSWGWNEEGQLGLGGRVCSLMPAQVRSPCRTADTYLDNVTAIDAGLLFSIALRRDGSVWAWGRNRLGTMGDDETPDQAFPMRIAGLHSRITGISAGHEHVLFICENRYVYAIGRNRNGQLGDGYSMTPQTPHIDMRSTPARVRGVNGEGFLRNIVQVAGGGFHSAARCADGYVYVWGRGDRGQLGNGTNERAQVFPVKVRNADNTDYKRGITYIASSSGDTNMMLHEDGTVWTMGRNEDGQLGDGTFINRNLPVQVIAGAGGATIPLSGVFAISAGHEHMAAVLYDERVYTWGANWDGQLGAIDLLYTITPQQVYTVVHEWWDYDNPLPNGSPRPLMPPRVIGRQPLTGITAIEAGHLATLALNENQTVYGWGRNNHGQLVMQQATDHRLAVQLLDFRIDDVRFPGVNSDTKVLNDATHLSLGVTVGHVFGLAITSGGRVYGWGDNDRHMLGIGDTSRSCGYEPKNYNPRPMQRVAGVGVVDNIAVVGARAISAGGLHSLAALNDGTVWSAGHGANGRLGGGNTTARQVAQQVTGQLTGVNIVGVTASSASSFAWSDDGRLWAWGYNAAPDRYGHGRLGLGTRNTEVLTPTRVNFPAGVYIRYVSSFSSHAIALDTDGNVWAWGQNGSGQLGDNTQTNRSTPVRVSGLSNIRDISAGPSFSTAVGYDGSIWTWGYDGRGRLGRGTGQARLRIDERRVPGRVTFDGNAIAIAAGSEHVAVLRADGTVWTWGSNNAGTLGNGAVNINGTWTQGATNHRAAPVRVRGGGTGVLHFSTSPRYDRIHIAEDMMHPVAFFFLIFGLVMLGILILLIVLFILYKHRLIEKMPAFLAKLFDSLPPKRKPKRARATAGGAANQNRNKAKPSQKAATNKPAKATASKSTGKAKQGEKPKSKNK